MRSNYQSHSLKREFLWITRTGPRFKNNNLAQVYKMLPKNFETIDIRHNKLPFFIHCRNTNTSQFKTVLMDFNLSQKFEFKYFRGNIYNILNGRNNLF